jgi:hypothetical protein
MIKRKLVSRCAKQKRKQTPSHWIDPLTGVVSLSSKKMLKPLMSLSEFFRSPLGSHAVLTQEDRDVSTFHHLGAFAYQKGILKNFDLGKHPIARNAFHIHASFL